jgi:hypothetical protein
MYFYALSLSVVIGISRVAVVCGPLIESASSLALWEFGTSLLEEIACHIVI